MRILVAIDSSPFASEILDEVAERQWHDQCEIRFFTAVDTTGTTEAVNEFVHQATVLLEQRVRELKKKLKRTVSVSEVAISGPTVQSILQEAGDWHADLIMIGSHGDTGVRRGTVGSVAAAIVNEAPCSVEVVKVRSKKLQATR